MLSMKTLRVAIVTMGSALLLGSGLAAATVKHLDGTGMMAPTANKYAAETVPIASDTQNRQGGAITPPSASRPSHFQILSPNTDPDGMDAHDSHKFVVSPSRRIEASDGIYLRLSLGGGMVFAPGSDASLSHGSDVTQVGTSVQSWDNRIAGGMGRNFVVFEVDAAIPLDDMIWVDVNDDLAVPAGSGSYTATISTYSSADDAIDGIGATSTAAGSATIITVESGIHAEVKSMGPAIADVATEPEPFLWFKTASGNSSKAVLGSATAVARGAGGVFNAETGDLVMDGDLIGPTSLTIALEGDFSIGAFNLGTPGANDDDPETDADESQTLMDSDTICLGPGEAGNDEPAMGNVNMNASEDNPTMSTFGMQGPGTQYLCVQVDRMGAGSNRSPIPATTYMGTVTMGTGEKAMTLAEGTIGEIKRNGTTVQVAYLTKSEKYNQRLIIVNRGPVPARFDIGGFTPEVGSDTTVELSAAAQAARDAGLNVIPAGGQVVLRVADLLSFTGDMRRTGATISINADVRNIQVATTQVNLEDGSTDTVVYASEDGARIQ